MAIEDGGEFLRQAAICRSMGSAFCANVLEAGIRQLERGPQTAYLIANFPGDRAAGAVALRFNGGMHALARRAATPGLIALYRDLDGDFDAVIGNALAANDIFMARWMMGVPQTNEVARSSAIAAGLLVAADRFGMPFELLELGASAGLQLNLARFGFDLGGVKVGDSASPVVITPEWRGSPPPVADISVVAARGADINPLDPADARTRDRLLSYVWADQPERSTRLEGALDLAVLHPPRVDKADALGWVKARLAEPQAPGVCRVVFHSIVLQYLPVERRAAVCEAIADAGARATADRPLAWVSFEWDFRRSNVKLELTTWPDGETRDLATSHAHAAWIEWH